MMLRLAELDDNVLSLRHYAIGELKTKPCTRKYLLRKHYIFCNILFFPR